MQCQYVLHTAHVQCTHSTSPVQHYTFQHIMHLHLFKNPPTGIHCCSLSIHHDIQNWHFLTLDGRQGAYLKSWERKMSLSEMTLLTGTKHFVTCQQYCWRQQYLKLCFSITFLHLKTKSFHKNYRTRWISFSAVLLKQTVDIRHLSYSNSTFYMHSPYTYRNKIFKYTVMRRIMTFRSMTDRIYDSGKNFWKLWTSWLWRKITCQRKLQYGWNLRILENGWLKELSSIMRRNRCQGSRSMQVHSVTFERRQDCLMAHLSERIPIVERCVTLH